jgi:hypothetical protein
MKIQTIHKTNSSQFDRTINKLLEQGWKLCGEPKIWQDRLINLTHYVQFLKKED